MSKENSTLTPEEAQQANESGQWEGSHGHGPSSGSPWQGLTESNEHYQDRNDAHRAGWENGIENQPKK